ncbi:MAG: GGDEF domain-containing protein [Lysobacteraceae bacterium]|nr:MAG: GGDEF domain-containing protein [Xanthomonadaceae bacterium]
MHSLVVNSLEEQIAVIDRSGHIVDTNLSWGEFGRRNGLKASYSFDDCNYLEVLADSSANGDDFAQEAVQGLKSVIDGHSESFYLEYPCHSPDQQRWFIMRMVRLKDSPEQFVVSHHDITDRKLVEQQAEYLAMHDPLTDLANRRYFEMFLKQEFRRSIRKGTSISLLEIDLDHFKRFNDEFGHVEGDDCLIRVGRVLQTHARRPTDLAARLGGDEFALVMGETNNSASQHVADTIEQAMRRLNICFENGEPFTASVGVVSMVPDPANTEDQILRATDKALYKAKLLGRGKVVRGQLQNG